MSNQNLEPSVQEPQKNQQGESELFEEDFLRLLNMSKRSIEYLLYAQNYLRSVQIAFEHKFDQL